jgi:pyruvate-ferredoxin/flavodoxin oxidoreductase
MNEARRTVDGNEAAASVAYRASEVVAIYPITPASPMGELADEWASRAQANLWGNVPTVTEMQSEGGAAGAVHGALQAGTLTTTFTASQGLLLMLPNLYKIAGELTSFCMHVATRTVATHALSIFCDHSDVMACRGTGFALLGSNSVQEAHDLAAIAHAATLAARVPFIHFFDGFRTSHEVSKIRWLSDDDLRFLIDDALVAAHRARALTPDRPVVRGTAQNPDAFFQAREAINSFYAKTPGIVERTMDRFAERTGRRYRLFEYYGHPEAERVVVVMGSGADTARATVEYLAQRGERVGVVVVRLYRPFAVSAFVECLPRSVRAIAALDRTKEPGALGEPLYLDVVAALAEAWSGAPVRCIGGRYGLSSKEFSPAMVKAVLDELARPEPRRHFTVGIVDDVTQLSLPVDPDFYILPDSIVQAVFYGLGSDGTVGANKNSIKIIATDDAMHVQGYFVYDSKKAGAVTVSHLRFGPVELRAPYLVGRANFVACHQFEFLDRFEMLDAAKRGAVLLLNSQYGPNEVWDKLPREVQERVIERELQLYVIDAYQVARDAGLGRRINTVMQTCFFAISGVLPVETAIAKIKDAIAKSYSRKGSELVRCNVAAVDAALAHLGRVEVPKTPSAEPRPPVVPREAPEFVQRVTAALIAGHGDLLPVSAFPPDGTWPLGTSRWEKRNIAPEIPVWDAELCIQCNKCTLVCPHAAIRAKVYDPKLLDAAPDGFKSIAWKSGELRGQSYTIQVAPEDCTGCNLCVEVCPAKDKSNPKHKAIDMHEQRPLRDAERERYAFFLGLPNPDRRRVHLDVKEGQLLEPLFEHSGACPGCGETPYIKLMTQLFGDRALIANATGCSSIYGGNLPTTPYSANDEGRGPAWSNSLFEDNAEFGFGMRLAVDAHAAHARELVRALASQIGGELTAGLLEAEQHDEASLAVQRERVTALRRALDGVKDPRAERLDALADYLVRKSVWLVGGDGWAYDIGYGGLDHVLASTADVNVVVLDTEVYSNTGGQQSKATPLGAAAKFAVRGKATPKKDLGLLAMSYGHVYVARVAFGAKDAQTVHAFVEADAHPGPSLIIAYSHCIAHGYDMALGAHQQKLAVDSGAWPLYRFDPKRIAQGEPPLLLESRAGKARLRDYMRGETRFRMVESMAPKRFEWLTQLAEHDAARRVALYEQLARVVVNEAQAVSGRG